MRALKRFPQEGYISERNSGSMPRSGCIDLERSTPVCILWRLAHHMRCHTNGSAPLGMSRIDGVGGHELFKVVGSEFSVQRRSTHFQVARHTSQIPSMHADRPDDQLHFNPPVSNP